VSDGGPAFPFFRQWENQRKGYTEHEWGDGMSLRDYFAGVVMNGLVQSIADIDVLWAAGHAYKIADAMIATREVQ
jgi:hypothetical protein